MRKVTVYVSDFGKKRMELESRYGPQGIWKIQEEDDEVENNEDLYAQIIGVDEAEEELEEEEEQEEEEQADSNSDDASESSDNDDSESEEERAPKGKNNNNSAKAPISRKAAKAAKKGDFLRKNGAVGLVMHHDLKLRGVSSKYRSEESDEDEQSQSQSGSDDDSQDDSGSDDGSDNDEEDQSQEGGAVVRRKSKKSAQSKKAAKKQLKDGEGFDEVALRKYELSKLR